MKRLISLATVLFAVLLTAAAAGAGNRTESDGGTTPPSVDQGSALVQLKGDPLSTVREDQARARARRSTSTSTVRVLPRPAVARCATTSSRGCAPTRRRRKVTGEFDISLNAVPCKLNGATLDHVAAAPMVARAQYQGLYYPIATDDPDLALDQRARRPGRRAAAPAGDGRRRQGRDRRLRHRRHASVLRRRRLPGADAARRHAFTNNKVIAAKVFNNKAAQQGLHAEAIERHGTHVAGTVACNLAHAAPTVDGVADPVRHVGRRAARRCSATTTSSRATSPTPAPRTS